MSIREGERFSPEEYKNHPRFANIKHKHYVPVWNQNEKTGPLEDFVHVDAGHRADSTFPNLLPRKEVKVRKYTPKFGTEIKGVQLSSLSESARDELALLAAQRGVIVFRNQDLKDCPVETAAALGRHFGRNHIHPTEPNVPGSNEVYVVYREQNDYYFQELADRRTNRMTWHADISFERQPSGTTILGILERPELGGDTVFADTTEAYERLSPAFQDRLKGLKAVYSSEGSIQNARALGGVVRRDGITTEHPIVRIHPVTKKKSLFVNPERTQYIVGFKREESEYLLNFLYDHITKSADLHVRANWEDGTVVVFDNRRCIHSAILDWNDNISRHAFLIKPQAERPTEELDDISF
ncbi:TauD-domain-containing protein [Nadsonia fulvescens var. elongata DSM 6958]|uniref:TauD-domain-containing protein n=1 Tax=Nadsonia fulvescens var. elongata DSM 6958 TaxID=857566 RepID=A0A1E3PLF4_9ASCO|nr:TauD-domain-containing protein [Nadsonia fulvescens var. elongata DSM 6958]